jgi:translation initiation factor 2 alpha subunit (eIF-2alpha)
MGTFKNRINKALQDPKNVFFKKHKVSSKNIQLMRKAKAKNVTKVITVKPKRKKIKSSNKNYKTLLGA